tara:strand:- start:8835 stop:9068 length:234 start_codon:yes stop_codon:yes gene_type:complete
MKYNIIHAVASGLIISTFPDTPSPFWTCGTVIGLCDVRNELVHAYRTNYKTTEKSIKDFISEFTEDVKSFQIYDLSE